MCPKQNGISSNLPDVKYHTVWLNGEDDE